VALYKGERKKYHKFAKREGDRCKEEERVPADDTSLREFPGIIEAHIKKEKKNKGGDAIFRREGRRESSRIRPKGKTSYISTRTGFIKGQKSHRRKH